jgi:hypothetical protein
MGPGPARRLSRVAATLAAAPAAVAAVTLWGAPGWARPYALFVAVTLAAVLVAEAVASRRRTRPGRPRPVPGTGRVFRGR